MPLSKQLQQIWIIKYFATKVGTRDGVVVKTLRYEPVGREFDSRWSHWDFSVT